MGLDAGGRGRRADEQGKRWSGRRRKKEGISQQQRFSRFVEVGAGRAAVADGTVVVDVVLVVERRWRCLELMGGREWVG